MSLGCSPGAPVAIELKMSQNHAPDAFRISPILRATCRIGDVTAATVTA